MKKHLMYSFRINIIFLLMVFGSLSLKAQRETKTINEGWKFMKGENSHASDSLFNDNNWENIKIPHTWNADAYIEKDYYRGIGWYRRALYLTERDYKKQVFLKFEASNQAARVFVNGHLAGEHKGGYTAFTFDITRFCSFGKKNIVAVEVNNALSEVPPVSGDFTFFGGIYRDVWLIMTPKQHLDLLDNGSGGVFIDTPEVSQSSASFFIRGEVKNDALTKAKIKLIHQIYTPQGNILQRWESNISLGPGEKKTFKDQGKKVLNPQLWSPESPGLYVVETMIRNADNNQLIDRVTNNIGFRWYKFDGENGFFLNGKPYKLRGICRHQDQKPIGNALSDEMHRRDMILAKDMGANFIRISHYPQDEAVLEQCDKLGILAWEEIPIIDMLPDSKAFEQNCETSLREMIRQHYNHPAIITWGYMNEILLATQRKFSKEQQIPVIKRTLDLANRLEKILKTEDPYRLSTIAFHGSEAYNEVGLSSITDVIGWNLYQGWYGGKFTGFNNFLDKQHENYPDHPIIISEYGAGSDRRLHSFTPQCFDFSIEYQQNYIEYYLPVIEQKKYVSGSTLWNFIDFSSALRDESMPRINNKGVLYNDRTPKDVFYYYKSLFRKDIPVLHIASRDWIARTGIQQGNNPVSQSIKVYSNLDEIELFIDGQSLGVRKTDNCNAVWSVPFTFGKHYIYAKGSYNSILVEDGLNISFQAIPEKLNKENLKNLELAINVGSNSYFTSDESGLTWICDKPYTPGSWGYVGGEIYRQNDYSIGTQTQIENTSDNPLYQTLRTGLEAYKFDVPEGEYEIELLFADVFNSGTKILYNIGNSKQTEIAGSVFDIYINNRLIDEDVNIGNLFGYFNAVKKRFVISVSNEGGVCVRLSPKMGKNFLNGIKLRKL